MIIVNVKLAEIGKSYDFKVDESVPVEQVIQDMVEMIEQEEHYKVIEDHGLFMLCKTDTQEILSPYASLLDAGVTSGSSLLLI